VKKVLVMAVFAMLVLGGACLLAGCGTTTAPSSEVKEPETIIIVWLPNNSGDNEKAMRDEMAAVIAKATGKKVENKLTTDYAIAISALESGDAQLGFFGPYEYIMSHAKNPKVIPLVVESGNSGTLKDALYYSRFLVKKGNEDQYKTADGYDIDNIMGKKMSFVSTSSTSGFNMPAAVIKGKFDKMDKWKNISKDDLTQGGSDKFFVQVLFAGSHQLSLVNVLTGKSDVSAVDDVDVMQYLELVQGTDNQPGAVYAVKQNADSPFDTLAGTQFVVIKSIPIVNTPMEANSGFLTQKTMDAITQALTADAVANDAAIFAPKGSKGTVYVQPHRFVKVDDLRQVLGLKK
jgi:phosphonate transport system substrate-binding protein